MKLKRRGYGSSSQKTEFRASGSVPKRPGNFTELSNKKHALFRSGSSPTSQKDKDGNSLLTLDDYVVSFTHSTKVLATKTQKNTLTNGFQSASSMLQKQNAEPIAIEEDEREKKIRLDDMQRKISQMDIDRPLLIVAGAGSGKTTTLCARVLEMLKAGKSSDSILVITFTNKAARELKDRILKYMRMSGMTGKPPMASTFHSWCFGLIMKHFRELGLESAPMVVAAQSEQSTIAQYALAQVDDHRLLAQCEVMLDMPEEVSSESLFMETAEERWQAVIKKTGFRAPKSAAARENPSRRQKKAQKQRYAMYLQMMEDEMAEHQALYEHLYEKIGKARGLQDLVEEPLDYSAIFEGKDLNKAVLGFIYKAKSHGDPAHVFGRLERSVLEAYNATLRRFNLADFDDMLTMANKLLDKPALLDVVQRKWPYLLVDEFQDLNRMQMDLVLKMQSGHGRVTAVGDERQSIYGFRGATCEDNFQTFLDHFVDAQKAAVNVNVDVNADVNANMTGGEMATLTQNYRSHQSIVDLGNIVAKDTSQDSQLLMRLRVPLTALESAPVVPVSVWESADITAEARNIAQRVADLIEAGDCKASDVAVISRCLNFGTYRPTGRIETELLRRQIPFVVRGGHSALQSKRMQLFMALVRVVANTEDDIAVGLCVPEVVYNLGQVRMKKITAIRDGNNHMTLYEKILKAIETKNKALNVVRDGLKAFVGTVERWQGMLEKKTKSLQEVVRDIFQEYVEEAEESDNDTRQWNVSKEGQQQQQPRCKDPLWEMVEAMMESFLDDPPASLAMVEQADGKATLAVLQAFSGQVCMLSTSSEDNAGEGKDAVVITTVHQAKGLEWEHVFVPHFNENLFPMGFRAVPLSDRTKLENIERQGGPSAAAALSRMETDHFREEGRLAYVAITRAKRGLYMSVLEKYPMPWMSYVFAEECSPSRYLPAIMISGSKKQDEYDYDYGMSDFDEYEERY